MVRKILLVVGLMLGLSLGFAVAANAAAAEAAEVEGSGRLWIRGIGHAEVHGNGAADISVRALSFLPEIARKDSVPGHLSRDGNAPGQQFDALLKHVRAFLCIDTYTYRIRVSHSPCRVGKRFLWLVPARSEDLVVYYGS